MRSASVGVDVAAGEHDVERARRADLARQQVRDAELARGEAVVDAGGAEVRGVGADADVARAREAEAAADRGAVDRADHRLVHLADREDHVVEQFERAAGRST